MTLTTKGLTRDQRRRLVGLHLLDQIAIVNEIHAATPAFVNPDGVECCRLNQTSCERCPHCPD